MDIELIQHRNSRGLTSSLIISVLQWLFRWARLRLQSTPVALSPLFLLLASTAWLAASAIVISASQFLPFGLTLSLIALPTAAMISALYSQPWKLWRMGVIGGDASVSQGVDYPRSLNLCRSSLSFLGTAAAKLTKQDEFIEAVRRCSASGRPVRLLLLEPSHQTLENAARRANVQLDDYRRLALDSLRAIRTLKEDRSFDIQVRFYTDNPAEFRLVIIDERLCLLSYNVFGEGGGEDFPQLHIMAHASRPLHRSFLYPLVRYYEWLWERSQPWDFNAYT